MRKTALVTGASAGIGDSFARLLAAQGYDLVVVARDEARLQKLAFGLMEKYQINVEVIRADLSRREQYGPVEARLASKEAPISVLINNAGFGINKSFMVSNRDIEDDMLQVMVTAPMRFCHAVLPGMKERNDGIIINVSSVAGWIASGTYSAAKAYVTVLSESLHAELRGTAVKVCALCPGFTHTEFHERGRLKMGGLPNFLWLNADALVAAAWKDAVRGRAISVPGWQYKILSFFTRFGPRPFIRNVGFRTKNKQRVNP